LAHTARPCWPSRTLAAVSARPSAFRGGANFFLFCAGRARNVNHPCDDFRPGGWLLLGAAGGRSPAGRPSDRLSRSRRRPTPPVWWALPAVIGCWQRPRPVFFRCWRFPAIFYLCRSGRHRHLGPRSPALPAGCLLRNLRFHAGGAFWPWWWCGRFRGVSRNPLIINGRRPL